MFWGFDGLVWSSLFCDLDSVLCSVCCVDVCGFGVVMIVICMINKCEFALLVYIGILRD